jgi:chemotaxis protein methyltransferase CheR
MPQHTAEPAIHSDNYRLLQEQVYSQSGIVLGEDKHYLFETRLAPILRQRGLTSINDLCSLLRGTADTAVGREVVEAMTTNETYFFRDPAHYDAISKVLLPRLREERRDTKKLSFWSAAASTGQESYSLAMLLLEEALAGWNIQILGTDFSSQVLERARSGTYQQIEVNRGLRAALLVKHFRRAGVDWQLSEQVRGMVQFEGIDLRKSMRTLGPFDLVFCRNVMIYFDTATKLNILRELHSTLFRGGWLLLGGAETVFGIEQWFEKQTVGNATVYAAR